MIVPSINVRDTYAIWSVGHTKTVSPSGTYTKNDNDGTSNGQSSNKNPFFPKVESVSPK